MRQETAQFLTAVHEAFLCGQEQGRVEERVAWRRAAQTYLDGNSTGAELLPPPLPGEASVILGEPPNLPKYQTPPWRCVHHNDNPALADILQAGTLKAVLRDVPIRLAQLLVLQANVSVGCTTTLYPCHQCLSRE